MATLQQQRQTIAQGIAASRQATATAERQATGQRIVSERTGKAVVEDLNRLVTPARQRNSLRSVPAVGAVPASRGRGEYVPPASTTGGIASPLTEPDASSREYWASGLLSSDGLFVMPAIKVLNLTDANDADVQIQLADPSAS